MARSNSPVRSADCNELAAGAAQQQTPHPSLWRTPIRVSEAAPNPHCMPGTEPAGNLPLKIVLLTMVSVCIGWLAAVQGKLGMVPGIITGSAVFGIGLFSALRLTGAPAGLWITFGLKFFSVTAYKIVTVILVSYLSKDCFVGGERGFSDAQAQWLFGAWGVFMSIATVLSGSITDAMGL